MRWWPRWRRSDSGEGDAGTRDAAAQRDELLSAYLDGALTPAEARQAEALLAGDAGARATLEELRMVRTALRELGPVTAPRSFALPAVPSPAPRGLPRLELATRAGAVLAAASLVVVLVSGNAGDEAFTTSQSSRAEPAAERASDQGRAEDAAGGASSGAGQAAPAVAPSAPTIEAMPARAPGTVLAAPATEAASNAGTPVVEPRRDSPPGERDALADEPLEVASEGGDRTLLVVALAALTAALALLAAAQWIARSRRQHGGVD